MIKNSIYRDERAGAPPVRTKLERMELTFLCVNATTNGRERLEKMTMEGFADDGTMLENLAQFDLAKEMADSEQKKPWKSGHYAKTLFKKSDFRMVLISMERDAGIKEHHADGTISVQVLKGSIRFTSEGIARDLFPGSVLTLGASIKHEVESLDESAFLLTISWPDSEKLQTMKHRGYGT